MSRVKHQNTTKNKIKEGTPVTREPEIPLILTSYSVRDKIQYGHLKVTYTYSPRNKVYYWVASRESFTSLAKSSTWWSCEHWSQISGPFYPNPCSCALQHSPTSTSYSSVNSTLNKCRIKNVQPQKPISLLLPSPTRVVISEKSFGFLPSFHVNLETT